MTSTDSRVQNCGSSYLSIMNEIHVLLVDHDMDNILNTAKLLELCQYKVSLAEFASSAIQMLLNEKVKFDFILANINSPDNHGFNLLQQSVNMNIPFVVMSHDNSSFVALKALENGAFFYLKKPITIEMLKPIWQHVAKERLHISRGNERLLATNYNEEVGHPANEDPNYNMMDNEKFKKDDCTGGGMGMILQVEEHEDEDEKYAKNGNIKRKMCTKWTRELHEKFMEAVKVLGHQRHSPKDILELMNVIGLTRAQVASHLQKCRNNNWQYPKERKSMSSTDHVAPYKLRRFGLMPKLGTTSSEQTINNEVREGEGSRNLKYSEIELDDQNEDGAGINDQKMEADQLPTTIMTNNNENDILAVHGHDDTDESGSPVNTPGDFLNLTDLCDSEFV